MAQSDDGLMLSLSLGFREKDDYNPPPSPPPQVSLSPLIPFKSSLPVFMQQQQINKCPRSDAFQFSSDHSTDQPRTNLLRGIDVNRSYLSTNVEEEEEAPVSSPISTLSSVSGKRSDREEHDGERASSSDEEGGGDMSASRKKLRLCKEQAMVLEEAFREHNTLNPKQKMALAKRLNLRPRQVEVWFQNRRARTKLKQTEVDCEYLKRYCDNLTEENRRLQKELNDLRALKLSPKFYTNTSPPTTLTMCPQCERVNVSMSANITSLAATKPVETSRGSLIHHSHHQMMPLSTWAAMIRPQPIDSQHL